MLALFVSIGSVQCSFTNTTYADHKNSERMGGTGFFSSDNDNNARWTSLKMALIQYPLEGSLSIEQLCSKVEAYVQQASSAGSQILVIPELFSVDLLDLYRKEEPQFALLVRETYPFLIDAIRDMAFKYKVNIVAGSVPVLTTEGRIRNRSFFFGPNIEPSMAKIPQPQLLPGTISSQLTASSDVYQDKIFLTPDEKEWHWEGGSSLTIVNAPWGTTAIVICYDSEFPLISQTLAEQAVDVIIIPSMTGEPGFTRVRWSAQARAVEHMAYVMVTGTVGNPAPGWEMTGQAAVLGPSLPGFPTSPLIEQGTEGADEIVYAEIDLEALRAAKRNGDYYPARDQWGVEINSKIVKAR